MAALQKPPERQLPPPTTVLEAVPPIVESLLLRGNHNFLFASSVMDGVDQSIPPENIAAIRVLSSFGLRWRGELERNQGLVLENIRLSVVGIAIGQAERDRITIDGAGYHFIDEAEDVSMIRPGDGAPVHSEALGRSFQGYEPKVMRAAWLVAHAMHDDGVAGFTADFESTPRALINFAPDPDFI